MVFIYCRLLVVLMAFYFGKEVEYRLGLGDGYYTRVNRGWGYIYTFMENKTY